MRDLSSLGSGAVVTLIVTVAVALLLLARRRVLALLFGGASMASFAIMALCKAGFARPRPAVVAPIGTFGGYAFPSGHALLATAVFVLLGMVISRTFEPTRLRISVIVIAALLALLVGLTRVYLGAHYPTDVLAGWTIGLAWAVFCATVFVFLEGRGIVVESRTGRGVSPRSRAGAGGRS